MSKLLGTLRVKLSAEAQDFARGLNRAKGNVNSLSRSLNKLQSSAIAQVASFAAVGFAIKKSLEAANAFDAAQRSLAASAKLTGVSLATLQTISRETQTRFHLSASSANELTVTMSKLAGQAGQLGKTQQAVNAILDLGAAQGLTAAKTLDRASQILVGTDEGFDLLGLNMSAVWKKWAKEQGLAVGTMTDMQKQLAVLTEIIKDGETVRGSYRDFLSSAAGQQQLLSQGIQQTEVALGKVLQPALIALIPVLIKSTDLLQMSVRGWRELAASMVLVAPALKVVKAALLTGHLHDAMMEMDAAVAKWRATIAEITNPKPITSNIRVTPKPTVTNTTNDQARENILLTDAIQRSQILAGVAETRLGSQAKISDKLRIELALEDQLFTLRKNALNADKTLSDGKLKNDMLSLNLGHQREIMQLKLNAAAQQEADILAQSLRHRQQLKQTIEQQVSGIAGSALSGGGVSGKQIGASIGTVASVALPNVPIVSELLPAVGGFIGGLFDKDKQKPQPIVKGLDAIERAQRDTISTIKSQTDQLLNPQDRFLNLPSSFNVPDFRPSAGSSTSFGDMSVTININGATADPTDISREVERVMGEVLFEQRRTMAWGVLS